MKKVKIALFYRVWFDSGDEFLEAAEKLGIELVPINYCDLTLRHQGKDFAIFYQGKPLADFSLFYFRAVGSAVEWSNLLIKYAQAKNIPVVDEYLTVWGPERRLKGISGLILGEQGLAYPRTSLVSDKDQLLAEISNFDFPFILKISQGGRHGIGTLLVKDRLSLERAIKGRIEKSSFLIQDYIPNDGDYRIFLIGYKILAAFKRQEKEDKLLLDRSQGVSEVLQEVPLEIAELAQKAAEALKVEICAVDMVVDQRSGKPVIIEVNEAPEFRVMKKRANLDVAAEIINYLVKKAKKAS